jgi:bifunctional ADP-heptose synthase (sugar kinase/adenylyltransferase)
VGFQSNRNFAPGTERIIVTIPPPIQHKIGRVLCRCRRVIGNIEFVAEANNRLAISRSDNNRSHLWATRACCSAGAGSARSTSPRRRARVFDVSGAGDTVVAAFTLAIVAGASPYEAAMFSNHAAGIVVGKVGTATARPEELLESFRNKTNPQ